MKNSYLKKAVILLLFTTVILACASYILWQKNQAMVRDDYGMYLKSQYQLRDFITNCLKVRYQRTKLIDNLAVLKGEFISVEHVFEQVTVPENLRSFHDRGFHLCNKAFSSAIQGKPVTNDMNELQVYMEELDRLLLKLNYSQVIENKTSQNIYQSLNAASKEMDRE